MVAFWSTLLLQTISFLQVTKFIATSPASCLSSSTTIDALVTCLEVFIVPAEYYNQATYEAAQPTSNQRDDWKDLINSFLSVDGDCSYIPIPFSLQGIYTVEAFTDSMCVLYEASIEKGVYRKGWGFMIVPRLRTSVSRTVHFSAPHPIYDRTTVQQAAFLFESTGSQSLFVAGRTLLAFSEPSECVSPPSPSKQYYKTDPTHNNLEPFFDANVAISEWQHKNYGCPSSSCGFIQLHGKGPKTCPEDDIFLSSGLGHSSPSLSWYTDPTDRPIKRLQQNLILSFPSSKKNRISLPSDSHSCFLTATKNVLGRYLNGIDLDSICTQSATNKTATGEFIHVEQSIVARDPFNYRAWSQAVLDTFDAI